MLERLPREFAVESGAAKAVFDLSKFGPGSRSKCILYLGNWVSPSQFETLSGYGSSHNWRRTLRYNGTSLGRYLSDGVIKQCGKRCACALCLEARGPAALNGTRRKSVTNAPPVIKPAAKRGRKKKVPEDIVKKDSDSDSGISVTSDPSKASTPMDGSFESTDVTKTETSFSGGASPTEIMPDFITAVQEAMANLRLPSDEGCSKLNILLYILHRYKLTEDVTTVNEKVEEALDFLTRMNVLTKKFDDNEEKGATALAETSTRPREPLDPPVVIAKEEKPALNAPKKRGRKAVSKVKKAPLKKEPVKKYDMNKPKRLSPALTRLCGGAKTLSRREVKKRLWLYIKKKKLQEKANGAIVCDDKMKAFTKKKKIESKELLSCLRFHLKEC